MPNLHERLYMSNSANLGPIKLGCIEAMMLIWTSQGLPGLRMAARLGGLVSCLKDRTNARLCLWGHYGARTRQNCRCLDNLPLTNFQQIKSSIKVVLECLRLGVLRHPMGLFNINVRRGSNFGQLAA